MQKIDNIEIKNFKSIRHQKIEGCKRINVFIGPPNVGKSNILEAISLLTFIRQKRPLGLLEQIIRFERLSQLFNFSDIKEELKISFNNFYSIYLNYSDEESISLALRDSRNTDLYSIQNFLAIHVGKGLMRSGQTNGIDDFSGFHQDLQDLNVKPYKFISGNYYNKNVKYSALELQVPNGDNLNEVVVQNKELFGYFSELLSGYNIKLYNDDYIMKLELNNIPTLYPLSLLADTLIRLIFFKTAIASNKNSVLLFEEPEAHMYPPYVSKFTSDMIYDDNNNQFFIATHSPNVINDFMENLKKDDYSIYTVGYDNETGETLIRRMTDDELHEIYQYGVDLFLNLENYLPHAQQQ
ncbi:MAG: AAA family ATPase [Ferruginibacter sp.]